MTSLEILRREFDGEDGSFILRARCDLLWDWDAFRRLTSAMFDVADQVKDNESIELWIAGGFWFCDTWISEWTSHPNFSRPNQEDYDHALELIHNLAYFLFMRESPYMDDALRQQAKG